MVIVAFQGKQIETPDPSLPSSSVPEYFKLDAEFQIHIHTDRENYLIVTVVRGERMVSQRSKRPFKGMKGPYDIFSWLHLFHLGQLRSVSWIMTQLRMQQQGAAVCFAVSYHAEGRGVIEISCPFVFAQSGLINDLHTSSSRIQDPGSLTFLPPVDPE